MEFIIGVAALAGACWLAGKFGKGRTVAAISVANAIEQEVIDIEAVKQPSRWRQRTFSRVDRKMHQRKSEAYKARGCCHFKLRPALSLTNA